MIVVHFNKPNQGLEGTIQLLGESSRVELLESVNVALWSVRAAVAAKKPPGYARPQNGSPFVVFGGAGVRVFSQGDLLSL